MEVPRSNLKAKEIMRILCFSSNDAGATRSRRMKWVGYAARIGQIGDSQ